MHHVSVKKRKRERERACDGGGGRLAAVGWSRAAWRAACGGPLAAGRLALILLYYEFFLETNCGSSASFIKYWLAAWGLDGSRKYLVLLIYSTRVY